MRTWTLGALILTAAATAAQGQITVQITEADCSQLVRHLPSDDVAFEPGVDVDGNAVAPADLDGSATIAAPDIISIPLTLDLASRLGIPPGGDADYLARPVIGDVTITSDGRVSFNGMPLTSEAQHELAQLCQRRSATP